MDNENEIRRKFAEWVEWLVDRQDPHNFLVIPEFGVMPKSVDWEGFASPLVHPDVKDREVANSLRVALIAARRNVMRNFKTLAEVKQLSDEVIKEVNPSMTARHHEANSYMAIELCIRFAADERRTYQQRLKSLSEVLVLVSGLRMLEEYTLPKKTAKKRARNGGKNSAKVRASKGIDKKAVVAAAQEKGWPNMPWGAVKALAGKFECTADYIGEILAAAKKNQG